jgi:hypothetical protein
MGGLCLWPATLMVGIRRYDALTGDEHGQIALPGHALYCLLAQGDDVIVSVSGPLARLTFTRPS